MALQYHTELLYAHNSSVSNGRMHAMLQVPYLLWRRNYKGRKDRKKMGPKSRVYSALYNNTHLPCFRGSTSTSLGAQKPLSDTLYYIELPKHFSRHTRFFSCRLFFREACSVFFVTPISIITIAIYCLQISYGPCAFKSDNCSYSVWRLF